MTADELAADDKAQSDAILEARDPREVARLVFAYYHDADRADRTSRSLMYLHLGYMAGALARSDQRR